MNEHVFVDTKHQSPECSFISIEDWNYLLRHDLLKCYKFFLWQEFCICNKIFFLSQEVLPMEGILRIFPMTRMTGIFPGNGFFCDSNFSCDKNISYEILFPVTGIFCL